MKPRRSFSQKNLDARHEGPLGAMLAEALHVPKMGGYVLTHRFHTYPGRFHPQLPRTLLKARGGEGVKVFDPFMGGGTTLVEAMLLGLPCSGNDLNPVAGLVARERTRIRSQAEGTRLIGEAERIAAQVEALRREKRPPRVRQRNLHRIAPHYQQHLLAELLQWLRLVNQVPAGADRESLRAVLSSAVVKYSNFASDTQQRNQPPRYPKGAATKYLVARCEELADAQVTLGKRLASPPQVEIFEEDAALLPSLGWGQVGLILTSPPYPGTYDYFDQHRLRLDWLELEDEAFRQGELGPRRGDEGRNWSRGMGDVLTAFYRVLEPGGSAFLVLGDWMEGDHGVDAGKALRRIAGGKGWKEGSWASIKRELHTRQEKKAFTKRGKWEHLIELVRP